MFSLTQAFLSILSAGIIGQVQAVDPLVDLGYTKLQGVAEPSGATRWLGVRFAAPPTGQLRFAAPVDPPATTDVQDASQFRPICLARSASDFTMKPNKRFTTDEDCLYVNIFAPSNATPDSKLPVMYFIQGGGFQSLSNANFNGSDLARFGNMLVVQVNYRVGPYGFLQSKEVQAGASMNNGLKDQIQGLKWLKQHAAAFGGNPDQMVAVGDSAGATSVALLLAAFGDNDPGLIKGAIMESVSVATVRTLEQGQEQYNCLTNATGCDKQPDSLACLRGLDAKALQTENCQFNPNLDGDLVKAPTLQRFAEGKYLKVPTIAGTCTDEGTKNVPQSTDTIEDALKTINNQATQSLSNASLTVLKQTYLDVQQPVFPKSGKLWRQLATAHGDFRAHCITKIFQDAQARDGVKTFNYRYGPIDDEQEALGFGAYHTVELNGVFGPNNTDGAPPKSYSTTNAPIVPLTQAYWASFVKTLDPNAAKIQAGMPEWQAWTADGRQRLLFQNNTGTMEGMPTAQQDNCAMLAPMIPFIETPATDAQKATVELKKVNSQAAPPAAPPAPPKAAFITDVARMMAEADNEEHKKNNGTAKGGKKGEGKGKGEGGAAMGNGTEPSGGKGGKEGKGKGKGEGGAAKGNGTEPSGGGKGGKGGQGKGEGGAARGNSTEPGGGKGKGGKGGKGRGNSTEPRGGKGKGNGTAGGGGRRGNSTAPPTVVPPGKSSATENFHGLSWMWSSIALVCLGQFLLA